MLYKEMSHYQKKTFFPDLDPFFLPDTGTGDPKRPDPTGSGSVTLLNRVSHCITDQES